MIKILRYYDMEVMMVMWMKMLNLAKFFVQLTCRNILESSIMPYPKEE